MSRIAAREMHRFSASGREFVYLVPSAAIFALDETAGAILDRLNGGAVKPDDVTRDLSSRFPEAQVRESLEELHRVRAIGPSRIALPVVPPKVLPPQPFPLTTLVLNVTNQCNLSCTYCYEYGEDKLVDTEKGLQPKFMTEETARASVDFMLKESGENRVAHLTFFGGETLMNFPVLQSTIPYARERAAALGKEVDFSLTTNATLLRPEIIDFLMANDVGVTISMDGPKDVQDRFRVFPNGAGSYDLVLPRIKELLGRRHRRPVGARVTLTSGGDVKRIFRHLTEDVGFHEVGFAPVTTSPSRDHAIGDTGFDAMLEQFRDLAAEFRDYALAGRAHAFSNVKDTLAEIHKGVAKAYPCGAGLGLMGVATDGEVALCHRFAGSAEHSLGTVRDGVDRDKQAAFLEANHIAEKTDCHRCWARPLCSGGCYHEAQTRYGATTHPNLHYCEWIRGWTHTCLEIYGELSEKRPAFLAQFDDGGQA
ncbi:MAG TPA: quinohemoprotein amine dehydrogenase maturation protein [Vicinamibacteria bacterium]|nr:quinohemoprotein amine dehydrogenase maturation protein [Vicinamibacteria bacterium]